MVKFYTHKHRQVLSFTVSIGGRLIYYKSLSLGMGYALKTGSNYKLEEKGEKMKVEQPKKKVFVLLVDNEGGTHTWVMSTKKKAEEMLMGYVGFWWKQEMKYLPPTDKWEAVTEYFEIRGDESWRIDELEIDEESTYEEGTVS